MWLLKKRCRHDHGGFKGNEFEGQTITIGVNSLASSETNSFPA